MPGSAKGPQGLHTGKTAKKSISTAADLDGVFPALFTPLNDDDPSRLRNTIDYAKAKLIIDDLIAEGVNGLVPVGTTGQSPTVSHQQHVDFIRFVVDYVDGRVPVIAGAGSNCTRETVEMIQAIQQGAGELACLCVTGYYNNPPQEGLVRHYETVVARDRRQDRHLQRARPHRQLPGAGHPGAPGRESQHHRPQAERWTSRAPAGTGTTPRT